MADDIDYTIHGGDIQLVEVELDPEEAVRAEVGAMVYMGPGIAMQTGTGGGLFSGLKRMITGEGFFITSFVNEGAGKGHVGFAAPYPGKIVPIDLREVGGAFTCQKDAFLCAAAGVDVSVAFTRKLGAGIFGGEGFILQKLDGDGMAFVHAGGAVVRKTLADGETYRLDTGCLVGFTEGVDYSIKLVGGFKNMLFGGEGIVLATLKGPGDIYIQSLPFSRLADRIHAATAHNTGEGAAR